MAPPKLVRLYLPLAACLRPKVTFSHSFVLSLSLSRRPNATEFLRFAQSQDQSRLQWLTAVQEAQRLQRELDASLENVADLETKLYHARRILNAAQKGKQDAESERRALVSGPVFESEFDVQCNLTLDPLSLY